MGGVELKAETLSDNGDEDYEDEGLNLDNSTEGEDRK